MQMDELKEAEEVAAQRAGLEDGGGEWCSLVVSTFCLMMKWC